MWIGNSWFPRSVVLSLVECGASAKKLILMQASSWRRCLVEAEGTFSAILCSWGHSIPDEDVHGWALWPLQSRLFLKVDSEPNSYHSLCLTSLWCYLHGIGWSGPGSLALSLWDANPGTHLVLPSFCAGGCHGGRSDRASWARERLVGQPEWPCFSFFPAHLGKVCLLEPERRHVCFLCPSVLMARLEELHFSLRSTGSVSNRSLRKTQKAHRNW